MCQKADTLSKKFVSRSEGGRSWREWGRVRVGGRRRTCVCTRLRVAMCVDVNGNVCM